MIYKMILFGKVPAGIQLLNPNHKGIFDENRISTL
jgi:hypothetical protein